MKTTTVPIHPLRALPALALLALAACGGRSSDAPFVHYLAAADGRYALQSGSAPPALLGPDGSLRIGGTPVELTPTQQALLKNFHDGIRQLHDDAAATGRAGAATATTALASVAKGLASGQPDRIGPAIEAKAADIEAAALRVCTDLRVLHAQQRRLVAELPAFGPYATLDASEVERCATPSGASSG